MARPAAEIDNALWRLQRHLRKQIAWRARALVLELEVLSGAPVLLHSSGGLDHLRMGFPVHVGRKIALTRSASHNMLTALFISIGYGRWNSGIFAIS
jgi:hypothetical protein